jgi:hypothetical protein
MNPGRSVKMMMWENENETAFDKGMARSERKRAFLRTEAEKNRRRLLRSGFRRGLKFYRAIRENPLTNKDFCI